MHRFFITSLILLGALTSGMAQIPDQIPMYHQNPEKIIFTSLEQDSLFMCAVLPGKGDVHSMLLTASVYGQERHNDKIFPFDRKELLHFYSFDSLLTLLIYDKKDKDNLYLYILNKGGKLIDRLPVPTELHKEELVATPKLDTALSWIALRNKDSLFYYSYTPLSGIVPTYIPITDPDFLKDVQTDGIASFTATHEFPSIRMASFHVKLFQHEGKLIFIHDNKLYRGLKTTVHVFHPKESSVQHYTIPVDSKEGFAASSSFFLNGQVYRMLQKWKDIRLQSFSLGSATPLGEYHVPKEYSPESPLRFSSRYFLKSTFRTVYITDQKLYKRHNRFPYGQLSLLAQPLPDGGIQLNAGRYYEDNAAVFPSASPFMIGLVVMASIMTIKSIAHQGKGIEEYFSFNFADNSLSALLDAEITSPLNEFDRIYLNASVKNGRLDYLDYYSIGGRRYLGYTTRKKRDVLHLVPIADSTAPKGTE